MNRPNNLCFLAVGVLAVILMCAVSTQGDQYADAGREIVRIYGDQSVSKETKFEKLQSLAEFYEKYRDRIQLNEKERQWADQFLLKYKESFVEGAPPQGGDVEIKFGNDIKNSTIIVQNNSASKASGVEINRGTAIFGLALVAASYIFKSLQ